LTDVRDKLANLQVTVQSEKVAREENSKSLLVLQKEFANIDQTIHDISKEIIQQHSEQNLEKTTVKMLMLLRETKASLRVELTGVAISKMDTVMREKTKEVQVMIKSQMETALESLAEVVKQQDSGTVEALQAKIDKLSSQVSDSMKVSKAASAEVKEVAVSLKSDMGNLQRIAERAKQQSQQNSADLKEVSTSLLDVKELGQKQDVRLEDIEDRLVQVVDLVSNIDSRVKIETASRELSTREVRERLQDTKDRTVELGSQVGDSQAEIRRLVQVVESIRKAQAEAKQHESVVTIVKEKEVHHVLKVVEKMSQEATQAFVEKVVRNQQQGTTAMLKLLGGAVTSLKGKLDAESQTLERHDTQMVEMRKVMMMMMGGLRSKASAKSQQQLVSTVESMKAALLMERLERKKSHEELLALKRSMRSMNSRMESEITKVGQTRETTRVIETLHTEVITRELRVEVETLSAEAENNVKHLMADMKELQGAFAKDEGKRSSCDMDMEELESTLGRIAEETSQRAKQLMQLREQTEISVIELKAKVAGLESSLASQSGSSSRILSSVEKQISSVEAAVSQERTARALGDTQAESRLTSHIQEAFQNIESMVSTLKTTVNTVRIESSSHVVRGGSSSTSSSSSSSSSSAAERALLSKHLIKHSRLTT